LLAQFLGVIHVKFNLRTSHDSGMSLGIELLTLGFIFNYLKFSYTTNIMSCWMVLFFCF